MLAAVDWLVAGGVLFWLILALFGVLFLASAAADSGRFAGLVTVALFIVLYFGAGIDIPGWLSSHPWTTTAGVLAYLPLGVGWSYFRWQIHVEDCLRALLSRREEWFKSRLRSKGYGVSHYSEIVAQYREHGLPDDARQDWENYVDEAGPKAIQNKDRICFWIGYWPVSVLWFVIDDLVIRGLNRVYTALSAYYEKSAQRRRDKYKQL